VNKILITGASGFVGTNLFNYLKEQSGFDLEPISLRQGVPEKIEDSVFGIIHLAAKAHDLKNTSNESEYFQVNTKLTKQLFHKFLNSNASVFIFLSSVKAAADTVVDVLTEDMISNPITAYGKSKLEAEQYILTQMLPDWKRVYILRPCMIHGSGNKGNLNMLYNIVSKGIPWPLGAFENKRSFCSIENLCFIIKELVERKDIKSGIYNVSDTKPVSTNELILLISKSLKRKTRIWNVSKSLINLGAIVGDKLKLPLNTERLQKLTENYIVGNQKILTAIGKQLPLNSLNGLIRTFESFKKKDKKQH
jgi:nucleoside-diphosphate-sugar epimerase